MKLSTVTPTVRSANSVADNPSVLAVGDGLDEVVGGVVSAGR